MMLSNYEGFQFQNMKQHLVYDIMNGIGYNYTKYFHYCMLKLLGMT